MPGILAYRWWLLALRGVAAILFGILCFVWPRLSLYSLVILFGIYAIVDGAFNLSLGLQRRPDGRRWTALIVEGIVSVVAGVLTFFWPGITALVLLSLIAIWAIFTGVMEIVAAVRLRNMIRGEWLLGVSGLLSVVFGILLLLWPSAGLLAVVFWIGAYAVVFGALLVALAFRLRAWARDVAHRIPVDRTPAAV